MKQVIDVILDLFFAAFAGVIAAAAAGALGLFAWLVLDMQSRWVALATAIAMSLAWIITTACVYPRLRRY